MMLEENAHMRRYSRFVWGVYYLRIRFPGFSVTSWGRSAAHNAALPGSVADSQHLEFTAADLVWDVGAKPADGTLKAYAREVGLEVEAEGDHVHVELATNWH